MVSLVLGLALVLITACGPIAEPPGAAPTGQLALGQPLTVTRPTPGQAGTDHWQISVQDSQWIALMLVADAETVWSVDTGDAPVIEGCGGADCQWLVVAANSGAHLTIDVAWSEAFTGSYLLAAVVPPSGIRGDHATAMREVYSLAELESSLNDHGETAPSIWLDHVLGRLSALGDATPVGAAEVATVIAQRHLQVGQTAIPLALCGQALSSLPLDDESSVAAALTLRGLQANAHMLRGDYGPAREVYLQMDETAAQFGNTRVTVNVARSLSTLDLLTGHPDRTVAHLSELLSAAPPRTRLPEEEERVLWTSLGVACESAGRLQQAVEALERALTFDPAPAEEASTRVNLGRVLSRLGQASSAREQYATASERAVAAKDVQAQAGALSGLAELSMAAGQKEDAHTAAQQALSLFADNLPLTGSCFSALHTLTALALESGDAERAGQYIESAHDLLKRGDTASLAVLERTGAPSASTHWDQLAQLAATLRTPGTDPPGAR